MLVLDTRRCYSGPIREATLLSVANTDPLWIPSELEARQKYGAHFYSTGEIRRIESTMFVIGDLTLPTLEVYAHAGIVGESEVGPLVIPNICEEKELEILLKTLLVIIV